MIAVRTNLATRPYANRRLISLGLVLVIVLGGWLSRLFLEQLEATRRMTRALEAEAQTQQRRIAELRKRIPAPVKPDELSPQQIELITAASSLIERRVFPWSRLLRDLETHLGDNVRLTRINVTLANPERIDALRPGTSPMQVSMTVVGRQLDDVLDMMRSLQNTGRFSRLQSKKQMIVEGTQEIEYEVEMLYTPR
ncbi:MAG: hypothetical protein RMM98_13965 [Acidobacteriota bacterium]|nr:hypothetical protein [Blastocatellia bacterium]MDW8240711.1 hypothetical protein [Acidobacteriota bacterium]